MSHRIEYDLNVSFLYGTGEDEPIEAIAESHDFERTGGGGFGSRDMHFSRAAPPTETEISEITATLKALPFALQASIETWTFDENDEPVGDSVGRDLVEMEDA